MKTFRQNYKLPVWYARLSNSIFDRDNKLILDIRGYGRFVSELGEDLAIKTQDEIAKEIVELINNS